MQNNEKNKNETISGRIAETILFAKNSNRPNLQQFSSKNLRQYRKNDTAHEKEQALLLQSEFKAVEREIIAADNHFDIAVNGCKRELYEYIKSEYGSVSEYSKAKRQSGFVKSKRHSELSESCNILSKHLGECSQDSPELRARLESALKDCRAELYTQIKSEYGSIGEYSQAKKNRGYEKTEQHTKLIAKHDNLISNYEARSSALNEKRESIINESSAIKLNDSTKFRVSASNSRSLNELDRLERSIIQEEIKSESNHNKKKNTNRNIRTYSAKRDKLLEQSGNRRYYDAKQTLKLSDNSLERKAAKADLKLSEAESKLKTQTRKRRRYRFNHETGEIVRETVKVSEIKPIDGNGGALGKGLKCTVGNALTAVAPLTLMTGQLSKYEKDNSALEATMRTERAVERGARLIHRNVKKHLNEEPYKRVSKLQFESDRANAKFQASKSTAPRSRYLTKKQYMKRAQEARKATANKINKSVSAKAKEWIKEALKSAGKAVFNPAAILVVGKIMLIVLIILIVGAIVILPFALGMMENAVMGLMSTYPSNDDDILAAYEHIRELVADEITDIETNNPGYDLYLYHYNDYETTQQDILNSYMVNPHELISFLSAWQFAYNADEPFVYSAALHGLIQGFYDNLFHVNTTSATEIITTNYPRGEWGDSEDFIQAGDIIEIDENLLTIISLEAVDVDDGWNILYTVEVSDIQDSDNNPTQSTITAFELYNTNFSLSREYEVFNIFVSVGNAEQYIQNTYTDEQGELMLEMYQLYVSAQGNRPNLFP
jgi:hypothetical protein